MESNNDFYEAVKQTVYGLLHRQYYDVNTGQLKDPCFTSKTVIKILDEAIGGGGGHTMHPHIGDYWMVMYSRGIKIKISKMVGEDIVTEEVSRSLIIQIANKYLSEHKGSTQLTLFN